MADRATVILVPWYGPEDFERLRLMNDGRFMPICYESWRDQAVQRVRKLLSDGYATQIIRLNIEDYFDWLRARCEPDTAQTRLRYLHFKSGQAGDAVHGSCRPEAPKYH